MSAPDPDPRLGVLQKSSTVILNDDDREGEKESNMNTDALASRENGVENDEEDEDDTLVLVDSEGNEQVVDEDEFFEDVLQSVLENEDDDTEGDENDNGFDPTEACTDEEIMDYRSLLRTKGPDDFIRDTITAGTITPKKLCTAFNISPSYIRKLSAAFDTQGEVDDADWADDGTNNFWFRILGMAIMKFLLTRHKLTQYNTISDAVELLQKSKNILVITGAGISTNLGVPDFRSKQTGFYAKLAAMGFDDPQDVFDLREFKANPLLFFQFAGETYPDLEHASLTHYFIRLLQEQGKLRTNYTQNIDNVEEIAGIDEDKIVQCHGSWATATCLKCGHQVRGVEIRETVKAGQVAYCKVCEARIANEREVPSLKRKRSGNGTSKANKKRKSSNGFDDDSDDDEYDGMYNIPEPGVMKPDITFFGEQLPARFFTRFRQEDLHNTDLVLVIGTSLTVAPVSEIPLALPPDVPQIYISRDPCKHIAFDIQLLGDCDVIVSELVRQLGWQWVHEPVPEPPDREVSVVVRDEVKAWWDVRVGDESAGGEMAGTVAGD